MRDVVAIDCDLRRIHAWSARTGKVCYNEPNLARVVDYLSMNRVTRILFEVAGVTYGDRGPAAIRSQMRWAEYNLGIAGWLHAMFSDQFRVAPSSVWTRGFDVKTRHKMSMATAKNKDLRECQAMLWFYAREPARWVSFPEYLNSL